MNNKKINVSVLIPTLNEEKNISHAVESVQWADEIFIIDAFSADKTLEIARTYPNVQTFQHKWENYSQQKNWALDNLPFSNEWIFILDADERVAPELRDEIIKVVNNPYTEESGFYVNRRFIFLGKWIKHCGWYPSWNLRLFRRGRARYEDRAVNEHMICEEPIRYLKHDMIHENFQNLEDWLAKHNRYSTLEAKEFLRQSRQTGLKASLFSKGSVERKRAIREKIVNYLPFRPLFLFVYLYIFRLGFLDGKIGFYFCCLRAIQQFHIDLKIKELRKLAEKK